MSRRFFEAVIFIARCIASATLGYMLADAAGFPNPLWTSISALVVSQSRMEETRSSITGRLLGTILGACTVVVVYYALPAKADLALHITLSVGICAAFAFKYPSVRVGMLTCPIILLTAVPGQPFYMIAWYRGLEVIIGAVLAAVLHILADRILEVTPATKPAAKMTGEE